MISNRQLLLPYAAPYLAYVFIAAALGDLIVVEANYTLRILVVSGILIWAWKWYMPLTGPKSALLSVVTGTVAGLIGAFLWIALLIPFADPMENEPWSRTAFILRLLSAGLLVPIFEEILMRGFIFRLAWQWGEGRRLQEDQPLPSALDEKSVNQVPPGAWSWTAVLISTLIFTSGHLVHEWPASIAYGLFMAFLWIIRKDLLVCIIAHAVTNIALGLYVVKTGSWHLW